MSKALSVIEGIRQQIAAHDGPLAEARRRRDAVFEAAATFPGVLRPFWSGSLATGYVNHPVDDADGGMVLDRRVYPGLGPDGDGELPHRTVEDIQDHIRPLLRETYPNVSVRKMKRGLLINVDEPLDEGQDPTVDLVVALNRQADDALWIPNLEQERWDPSHPERHVELFTSGSSSLRRTRARVARLAKAQVTQYTTPTLSSFNVAALAWEAIQQAEALDRALHRFFAHATSEIYDHRTNDPAEVSGPIKLPTDLHPKTIVDRLARAADGLERAIQAGDDRDKVEAALAKVFPDYVDAPGTPADRDAFARSLRSGAPATVTVGAGPIPATRSYGGDRVER